MKFERGKDIKEAMDVGLQKEALHISSVRFEIGWWNPERYEELEGKNYNPLWNIRLELKRDYFDSAKAVLQTLNKRETPLDTVLQHAIIPDKRERRWLREFQKAGKKLFLLVELGTMGEEEFMGRVIRYISFYGKIQPVTRGPHFLTYPPYKSPIEKFFSRIFHR